MAKEKRVASQGLLAARLRAAKKLRKQEQVAEEIAQAAAKQVESRKDSDVDSGDEDATQAGAQAESVAAAYCKLLGALSSGDGHSMRAVAAHGRVRKAAPRHAGEQSNDRKRQAEEQPSKAQAPPAVPAESTAAQPQAPPEGADAVPAVDHFSHHFGRQLTEAEVAQLRSSKLDEAVSEAVLPPGVWRNADCQVTGEPLPPVPRSLARAGVQPRLIARWRQCNAAALAQQQQQQQRQEAGVPEEEGRFVSEEQRAFYGLCCSYKDVVFSLRPYPTSAAAPDPLMDACLLHCINHVAAAAARIRKNNERAKSGDIDAEAPRDQGFTRAKVLLLLPLRSTALRVVSRLLELAQKETRADSIQHKARFLEEYGADEDADEDDGGAKAPGRGAKPAEHATLFAGNQDDHFRLGIKVTRGAIKLYADFLQSDIIVASPIALATRLAEEPDQDATAAEGGPADFLSSIEVVVVERADVLLMQNWTHLVTGAQAALSPHVWRGRQENMFQALNRVPEAQHGADIMRVREAALAGWGGHLRQSILLSSFGSAEMNALAARACANWAGRVRLRPQHQGVLGQVVSQVRQVFERLPAASAAADANARFEHFRAHIWPRIREAGAKGQLVFVSSYFDYVRLRAFLKQQDSAGAFAGLSEYAAPSQAARARSLFADGRLRLALLSERAHFYFRAHVRGVRDLLFYQLPHHAHFYAELLNGLQRRDADAAGEHATVTVLYSRFDSLRLEPVVGSGRAKKMLRGPTSTFLFC